jgi:CxxC-x17-CxxC domain-containing protein
MAQSNLPDGVCGVKNQVSRSFANHSFIGGYLTMYEDKTLVCKDCGAEFVFTAGEQEFYAEKGFQNEPTRCKACRQARKANRPAAGAPRVMYDAICAECGKPTQVPFEPKEDRPVYCSECFAARRGM